MKKLFDFQEQFVNDIGNGFKRNDRVIGQLATGGGKGVILAEIARRSIAKGYIPCISCHRIEIFQQLYTNLREFGVSPGLIMQGSYPMAGHPCYLSMVETTCRRMDKGLIDKLNINFFILDEIHFGAYYKLVDRLSCKILGFTATPKSTGNPELKEYFQKIVCGPPIKYLIDIKRLLPTVTYSIEHDFSKVKMKGKEYDDKSLFAEFKKPKLWHGAVDSYVKHAKGMKALCFCVNVEHSQQTTLQFREFGFKAAHVDGTTDSDTRDAIFNMYRNGDLEIICNVGIATTGTDLPDTQCVIQNFATTSLVKHVQTLGRGSRYYEGQDKFITIDMGRNYIRHGEFGENIDWKHIFEHPEKATQREAKREKRECDECGAVIKFSLQKCPYCGDFISKEAIEEKLLVGASTKEVRDYRLKTVPPHLRRPVKDMTDFEMMEFAKHMGYSPKWIWIQRNLRKR